MKNCKRCLLQWQRSWTSEHKDFSNSESLCCTNASHQVSAQSNLWFWRRCGLKNFNMAAVVAILDIRTAILNFYVTVITPSKFPLNRTWSGRRCHMKNFKMPSWISEQNGFSNSESLCCFDASRQVRLNLT